MLVNISKLIAAAGCFLNMGIYRKIREKNVLYVRQYVIITGIVSFFMIGVASEVSEVMAIFFVGWFTASLCQLVVVRTQIRNRIVSQLVSRHELEYHKLTKQYNAEEFSCRKTKKIYRITGRVLQVCSSSFITKETELHISIKKEVSKLIQIEIVIKQLGRRMAVDEFEALQARVQQCRLPRNMQVKIQLEE